MQKLRTTAPCLSLQVTKTSQESGTKSEVDRTKEIIALKMCETLIKVTLTLFPSQRSDVPFAEPPLRMRLLQLRFRKSG